MKNKPARANRAKVGQVDGPDGTPKGATKLPGKPNNYIEIINNGKLDTKKSITMTIWARIYGGDGPVMQFGRKWGDGVLVWFFSKRRRLVAAIVSRNKVRKVFLNVPFTRMYKAWTFIGLTYDSQSGIAKLWINEKVTKKRVGRLVRIATKGPVRIGSARYRRRVLNLKADISCFQLYRIAVTEQQMRKIRKRCFKKGNLKPFLEQSL